MPSVDQVIVWLVVGLLGGSLAGLVITWERGGFGHLRNLGLGLSGAVVGGLLFRLFGLFPNLDRIADLVTRYRCRISRISDPLSCAFALAAFYATSLTGVSRLKEPMSPKGANFTTDTSRAAADEALANGALLWLTLVAQAGSQMNSASNSGKSSSQSARKPSASYRYQPLRTVPITGSVSMMVWYRATRRPR